MDRPDRDPALILFAHGARDARWAEPFHRVLREVERAAPAQDPMLAFLEFMHPDLREAIDAQVARGHRAIRVVPLFLGPGGHLRSDVPRLVDEARRAHPGIDVRLAAAAGEDGGVIAALAAYCVRSS
jgi:sirohydrochlorin cobaltochelatase